MQLDPRNGTDQKLDGPNASKQYSLPVKVGIPFEVSVSRPTFKEIKDILKILKKKKQNAVVSMECLRNLKKQEVLSYQ